MGSVGDSSTAGDRRRRVLFFPLPYQGHINPMFKLAGLLHARGFAITVFHTCFNAPDASQHPAYEFVPVPDDDGERTPPAAADDPDTVRTTVAHIRAVNRACEAPFRDRLASLLEERRREEEHVACLVFDAHLLTLADVARRLGVPTLSLRTGSAACFRCFMAFPDLCDKGYYNNYQTPQGTILPPSSSELDLDAPVTSLPPYRVRDLPPAIPAVRDILSRAVTAAKTSSGLILNTFDALEPDDLAWLRRSLAVPVFAVGPLHKISPAASSSLLRPDRACLAWLDLQPPASVLYVSFGSLASMSAADVAEAAWGVAGSGQPFLWALRPGLAALPDGFEAATSGRGEVVSWAPQEEVLAHPAVGAFWTHCGWNSTVEGVCAGVPMLCRACFGDQMGNARYVEQVWRVGVVLEGEELERGKVEAAIEEVMGAGELGEGMRRRARELGSRAAECVAVDGSSCVGVDKLVHHILSL